MNAKKQKNKNMRKSDLSSQIIQRKNDEIESLKEKISELQIDCEKKDELIGQVDLLKKELKNTVAEINVQRDEYRKLVSELKQMKTIMDREVFRGRWGIIRLLMK